MAVLDEPFYIGESGTRIHVQPRPVGRDRVYILSFEDRRKPLVITQAKLEGGGRFWTSVPEGRQEEADTYGPLVEDYQIQFKPKIYPEVAPAKPLQLFD